MSDINTRFDAPHSRYNAVTRSQLEAAGLVVLIESAEAGVHLAVSPDQFRIVYFQGHPEYDAVSLLKEYKRELLRYLNGELAVAPPFPENYFSAEAATITTQFVERVGAAKQDGSDPPEFPEDELARHVDNTWSDTGKAIINNWLGLVYRLTNLERTLQFMPDVDPSDPLQLGTTAPHG